VALARGMVQPAAAPIVQVKRQHRARCTPPPPTQCYYTHVGTVM
jgi:hypothetical protein